VLQKISCESGLRSQRKTYARVARWRQCEEAPSTELTAAREHAAAAIAALYEEAASSSVD